jgi:DNA-binding MarR family transcriptional regulator
MNARADAPPSQLTRELMLDLQRVAKTLENYSRQVEHCFGLTGPQLWALWEIGHAGPLSLKALASRMELDPSTVVGVVDRLLAKGLATRTQDATDRRRVSLALSARGDALLRAAPHPAQGHLLAGLERMQRRRVENLQASLRTLLSVLEAGQAAAVFVHQDDDP